MLLPHNSLLNMTADGQLTVVGVAAAGSVPAGAAKWGGLSLTSDGKLYVVYV